ncbi:hypothetical protein GE061_012505 [Apolygus lucorum]|uniref:Uncharacterized protein n=1 Tax=Apolygus lucorum TaxID=248454 RepID=A0A8S9XUS0_APOLU|nr:hypothetical protein GE061_012505 [Apolygus lucorum]
MNSLILEIATKFTSVHVVHQDTTLAIRWSHKLLEDAERPQSFCCLKPANERGVPDDSYITSPLDSVPDRQPEPVPYFHNVEEEMPLDDGDLPVTRIRTSVTPPTLQVGEVHPESPAHHATPESPLCQEEPMETATPPLSPVPTNAPSTPATLPVEEAQMTRMVEGSTRRQLRNRPRLDYQQLLKGPT